MASQANEAVIYKIDQNDNITYLNPQWDIFALANQADHLKKEIVLNSSLWTYISCQDTRQIYRAIFEKIRKNRTVMIIPYRCDSPDTRRFMTLEISASENATIKFISRTERVEKREPVDILNSSANRSEEFIAICSWCKKVRVEPDNWIELEHFMSLNKPFLKGHTPALSHSICPSCLDKYQV